MATNGDILPGKFTSYIKGAKSTNTLTLIYVDGHPVDILFISSYTVCMFVMYYIINNSRFGNKKEVSILYIAASIKKN